MNLACVVLRRQFLQKPQRQAQGGLSVRCQGRRSARAGHPLLEALSGRERALSLQLCRSLPRLENDAQWLDPQDPSRAPCEFPASWGLGFLVCKMGMLAVFAPWRYSQVT